MADRLQSNRFLFSPDYHSSSLLPLPCWSTVDQLSQICVFYLWALDIFQSAAKDPRPNEPFTYETYIKHVSSREESQSFKRFAVWQFIFKIYSIKMFPMSHLLTHMLKFQVPYFFLTTMSRKLIACIPHVNQCPHKMRSE